MPVSGVSLTAGTAYWVSILNPTSATGTLRWLDRAGGTGGAEQTSASQSLDALPATWATGVSWSDGPISGYVWGTPAAPRPPVLAASPTSLSFSSVAGGASPAAKTLSVLEHRRRDVPVHSHGRRDLADRDAGERHGAARRERRRQHRRAGGGDLHGHRAPRSDRRDRLTAARASDARGEPCDARAGRLAHQPRLQCHRRWSQSGGAEPVGRQHGRRDALVHRHRQRDVAGGLAGERHGAGEPVRVGQRRRPDGRDVQRHGDRDRRPARPAPRPRSR